MRIFTKVLAASVLLIGCATTAQAGTVSSSTAYTPAQSYSNVSVKKTATKKIVRKVKSLPQARKVATHSARTVLFYNPSSSRSKIISDAKSETNTPNLFN